MLKYPSVLLLFCTFLVAQIKAVPEGRILSGRSAYRGQFPHQILLIRNDRIFCGGSIISRNYILTAGHCVCGEYDGYTNLIPPNNFTIIAGYNSVDDAGVRIAVDNITVPRGYAPWMNDIALMKLAEPLNFSSKIHHISLARRDPPLGASVIISGYGAINKFNSNGKELHWTVLHNLPTDTCRNTTKLPIFWNFYLCLGHDENHGICHGDSGGPATYNNKLVGVSSFVFRDCGDEAPNAYTRVLPYLKWIKKHSDYSSKLKVFIPFNQHKTHKVDPMKRKPY